MPCSVKNRTAAQNLILTQVPDSDPSTVRNSNLGFLDLWYNNKRKDSPTKMQLAIIFALVGFVAFTNGTAAYRDTMGRNQGSSTTHGNYTTYRDSQGRLQGSSRTDTSGRTTYRDSMGRLQGTATTDSSGRVTYRDAQGRLQWTATTDSSGHVTYRDAQGRLKGTK